ncbi:MAG: iron-containing alcohol dehydrogenase [Burkholderiaceae bacterium]|nr:iron-containing alcohol dehydrogenase [Burkholderiaceae bacterium]
MQTHHWPAQQRVHAGIGALEAALPKELDAFGWQRTLLITTNSLVRSGMAERVKALLGDRCAGMIADIPAHSPVESVARLVAKFRECKADGVVALGGGSVIDATKGMLVALGAGLQAGDITGKALTGASGGGSGGGTSAWGTDFSRPRMIAVPTTLSAAEFTSFGGVTDTALGRKLMVGHPLAVPVVVIQDPACTMDTPAELLLSTGARSVDHSVEGFCAVNATPISDATAIEAARRMWSALPRMHADATDLSARADAQAAAWLSIQGRSGGVAHGASHGIGYLLGGGFNVPHGLTSCVMLPAVLRWNRPVNEARQQEFCVRVGLDPARPLADHVETLFASVGLATRLSQVGIGPDKFDRLAGMYDGSPPIATNPRKVGGKSDLLEIIALAA